MANNSNDGVGKVVGGVIFGAFVIVSLIPKEVWIALGVLAVVAILIAGTSWAVSANARRREEAAARAEEERRERAAAEKREREENALRQKQLRLKLLGRQNATRVETALAAIKQVKASEAARAGWLGDVDFTSDIREITDKFQKAYALQDVASQLSALSKPSPDDRKILKEAKDTAAELEHAARQRVELIGQCATEARRIDESLRTEREDARVAEQRAKLHGQLGGMLYGIEAAPTSTPTDSAADAVMARVQAYREIKSQIAQARGH